MLLIVHKDDDRLAAFFEAARSAGLSGFTVLPSHGIGHAAGASKPFDFAIGGLAGLFSGGRLENVTALSLVEDGKLPALLGLLKKHLSDLDEPGGGLYAVLPVEQAGSV